MRRKLDSAILAGACFAGVFWMLTFLLIGQGSAAGWFVAIPFAVPAVICTLGTGMLWHDARTVAAASRRVRAYSYGDDTCSCGLYRADECRCARGEGDQ